VTANRMSGVRRDSADHRRTTDLMNVLAILAAGSAYLLSALAGDATGTRHWVLLGLGVLAAAAAVAIGGWIQRRDRKRLHSAEEAAVEAQEQLTITLNGALAPITSYLGEMGVATDRSQRAAIGGKLRQAVVDAAVRLTGPTARASFYRFDAAGRRLVLDVYGGRSTLPRDQFTTGTEAGDVLIDLVIRGDLVFLPDVEQDRLITPTNPGDYETVIAIAVTAGPRALGLLTVDAAKPGELTTSHVELIRVLANLLGSGLVQQ
jgi:hypothetical protein